MITIKLQPNSKMVEIYPGIKVNEALVDYVQWRGPLWNLTPLLTGLNIICAKNSYVVKDGCAKYGETR